jgi:hypothetical protein
MAKDAGQQGDPVPCGYGEYGERKAWHHSMRPEPFPDLGVIQLIHFRSLAVSRAESVLCYRTLPLICTALCAIINQRGGALQTPQEGRQEGRGAVLRTSPCTSYHHQSISEAQTAQQEEGQGRWCATYITLSRVLSSTVSNSTISRKRERNSRGGGGCCCVVLCYVAT